MLLLMLVLAMILLVMSGSSVELIAFVADRAEGRAELCLVIKLMRDVRRSKILTVLFVARTVLEERGKCGVGCRKLEWRPLICRRSTSPDHCGTIEQLQLSSSTCELIDDNTRSFSKLDPIEASALSLQ